MPVHHTCRRSSWRQRVLRHPHAARRDDGLLLACGRRGCKQVLRGESAGRGKARKRLQRVWSVGRVSMRAGRSQGQDHIRVVGGTLWNPPNTSALTSSSEGWSSRLTMAGSCSSSSCSSPGAQLTWPPPPAPTAPFGEPPPTGSAGAAAAAPCRGVAPPEAAAPAAAISAEAPLLLAWRSTPARLEPPGPSSSGRPAAAAARCTVTASAITSMLTDTERVASGRLRVRNNSETQLNVRSVLRVGVHCRPEPAPRQPCGVTRELYGAATQTSEPIRLTCCALRAAAASGSLAWAD